MFGVEHTAVHHFPAHSPPPRLIPAQFEASALPGSGLVIWDHCRQVISAKLPQIFTQEGVCSWEWKIHWEHGKGWKRIDSSDSSWMLQTNKQANTTSQVLPYLVWCGRWGGCNKKESPKMLHNFWSFEKLCILVLQLALYIPTLLLPWQRILNTNELLMEFLGVDVLLNHMYTKIKTFLRSYVR